MSYLRDRLYAREWLEMALSKNELGEYTIGLSPYAESRLNEGGISDPILVPNLDCLYQYYKTNPSSGFDQKVESELYKTIRERGNNDVVIYHALKFVAMQLERERTNRAEFTLDCSGILTAIRQQIRANKAKFQTKSLAFEESVWPEIEYYERYISANYNLHVL